MALQDKIDILTEAKSYFTGETPAFGWVQNKLGTKVVDNEPVDITAYAEVTGGNVTELDVLGALYRAADALGLSAHFVETYEELALYAGATFREETPKRLLARFNDEPGRQIQNVTDDLIQACITQLTA